jgi:hypothetical protein
VSTPGAPPGAARIDRRRGGFMRAAVFKGIGQPLSIETRPDPAPGAGEMVLRVGRCGVCGTDLSMTDGSGQVYERDSVIGHEFAGAPDCGASMRISGSSCRRLPNSGCARGSPPARLRVMGSTATPWSDSVSPPLGFGTRSRTTGTNIISTEDRQRATPPAAL